MDDLQNMQTRQLKARLESIATAGEVLRVSLGASSLDSAVGTLLLGLAEVVPAKVLALFEVGDLALTELGRLVDGEPEPKGEVRALVAGEPALEALQHHRHTLSDTAPSLVGGPDGKGIFVPFEGRLGDMPKDGLPLRASHLLWIEVPEMDPSPEILDTLIALASQGGVLLTGFRYRDDLERTYSALREANKRLQKDIDRARRIQEGLLPQATPVVPGLTIDWKYQPAAKVSGDYFDCFPIDPGHPDGKHCLVIADVSGHGISASMVMAMFKVLLRREVRPARSLSETLGRLNRTLLDQVGGLHYVTVFLALVDPTENTLEWCSCGHCPQLLRSASGDIQELAADGVFVGMFDEFEVQPKTQPLATGDALLLYTDGITEAEDPTGELYGMERLRSRVATHQDYSPSEVLSDLLLDLEAFTQGTARADDLTLVSVRVG